MCCTAMCCTTAHTVSSLLKRQQRNQDQQQTVSFRERWRGLEAFELWFGWSASVGPVTTGIEMHHEMHQVQCVHRPLSCEWEPPERMTGLMMGGGPDATRVSTPCHSSVGSPVWQRGRGASAHRMTPSYLLNLWLVTHAQLASL